MLIFGNVTIYLIKSLKSMKDRSITNAILWTVLWNGLGTKYLSNVVSGNNVKTTWENENRSDVSFSAK